MESINPSPLLQPFIRRLLVIESNEGLIHNRLPDQHIVMAFCFRGTVQYLSEKKAETLPALAVTGLRKTSRLIQYAPDTGNILIEFRDTGAFSFFKQSVNELYGSTVSLADLIAIPAVKELEEQLTETNDVSNMIRLIEIFMAKQLVEAKPDLLVEKAVLFIRHAVGNISMRSLADMLYISTDAFEKRLRRMEGCSPKQFAYIIRMKHFIVNKISNSKLTEPALAAGFYDQPHFNREFKQFTGQTPSEFFRSPYFW